MVSKRRRKGNPPPALRAQRRGPLVAVTVVTAVTALAGLFVFSGLSDGPSPAPGASAPVNVEELVQKVLDTALATQDGALPRDQGPVYIALRASGERKASLWKEGDDWHEALADGIDAAFAGLDRAAAVDSIEIALSHDYRPCAWDDVAGRFSNVHRGVRGIELNFGPQQEAWSPTTMLARNNGFDDAIDSFCRARGFDAEAAGESGVSLRSFEAIQCLVTLGESPRAVAVFRGNRNVRTEDVTQDAVAAAAERMTQWLVANVHEDGRMTYKYWPSSGRESASNNMIRQFMATDCLARLADTPGKAHVSAPLERNLAYNFATFYREENGLGLIEFDDEVKLGAVALAALAIAESPFRTEYRAREEALSRTIDRLWNSNGAFTTFYLPEGRNDNQNFYPGEALLYWATVYRETKDPALLERIMKSFAYYAGWHMNPKNRNPAFVPWHTQAYYLLWEETKSDALADFVLLMNDWLTGVQEWDEAVYDDTRGRFYDKDNPHYGPPHASSTGVYLEGLIDAFRMARQLGDEKRAELYRVCILRGMRSVLQLQFVDDVDMYYISKRDRVAGGMRTTVYNNEIRVDNVQHNLMALLKIIRWFEPDDYRPVDVPR